MGQQLVVSTEVRLSRWVALAAPTSCPRRRTPPGRKYTKEIPTPAERPWFVECDPMLHPVSKLLEADLGVVTVVIPVDSDHGQEGVHSCCRRDAAVCFRLEDSRATYTIAGLRKPWYRDSSSWGRSQWKRVTKGFIPAHIDHKSHINFEENRECSRDL